jgi:serine/threonine-protein kinase RsbT
LNQALLREEANRKIKVGKVTFEIKNESDIVRARSRGRVICQELGVRDSVGIKVATVISELARNIFRYAGEGRVEIEVLDTKPVGIQVVASDNGPGIADVNEVLSGNYRSKTGMGMGLIAVRNIMDEFEVESSPGSGTRVTVKKYMQ